MRRSVLLGSAVAVVALGVAVMLRARSQEDHTALAPIASSLAASTSDPATSWHYVIDAKGVIRYTGVSGAHLENGVETLLAEAESKR